MNRTYEGAGRVLAVMALAALVLLGLSVAESIQWISFPPFLPIPLVPVS